MSIHRLVQRDSIVRAEASAWLAQLDKGDLRAADLEALREWIQRSPRHAQELRQLARLSEDLNVLTDLAGPLHDAARSYYVRSPASRRIPWAATAAILAVLAVVVGLVFHARDQPRDAWSKFATTAVGEQREVTLPDGSAIALNSDSRLRVSYGARYRNVRLLQGEALFEVARDPHRPFVVDAGMGRVEALGTTFAVRLDLDSIEVAVTHGRVRVYDRHAPAPGGGSPVGETPTPAIVLARGERVVIVPPLAEATPETQTVPIRELQRKLAWREGLLDFSETPLDEVVREVGRHTNLEILVEDESLRSLEFNGLFRIGDTGPLFGALKTSFGIDARYIDADTVSLSRRAQDDPGDHPHLD